MQVPNYLAKGDTVLIIATARARNSEAVAPAIKILTEWGLKVETGHHLFEVHHQFAGTDEQRTADLQWAIDHPAAKAVLFSGGGYGSLRIIDKVNFSALKKNPKWFVGYSDTTVLHSRLIKQDIACIHGTMAFQFLLHEEATLSVKKLLFGERFGYQIPLNELNRKGAAQGILVGGNLSILYALSGSVDELDTKSKILFIEDLDEQLYHIDRMMLQLKRSNKLRDLAGLVVGGMSEMKDNKVPFGKTAEEIILDAVQEYNYPVCFGFPAGHVVNNMALYLGREAQLEVTHQKINFRYT